MDYVWVSLKIIKHFGGIGIWYYQFSLCTVTMRYVKITINWASSVLKTFDLTPSSYKVLMTRGQRACTERK